MAFAQRSSSRSNKPFIARSKLRSVRLDIIRTLLRRDASASSNVPRICLGSVIQLSDPFILFFTLALTLGAPSGRALPKCASAKSAGDIVLRPSFARICENFRGRPKLDQFSKIKESGVIRDATGLLHVVRNRYDRVLAFELVDQFLNLGRGDWIKRGTRLIH